MKLKYPKLLLLLLTFIFAYIIFKGRDVLIFQEFLLSFGYLGTFISGILFTYGFTAASATAILLILAKSQNFLLAGIIAGFGALVGDLLIFKFVRFSFAEELGKMSREKLVLSIRKKLPDFIEKYFLPVLAGIILASPLPDEIGVSLLAASKNISAKVFSIISFLLNTIGILIILYIGKVI